MILKLTEVSVTHRSKFSFHPHASTSKLLSDPNIMPQGLTEICAPKFMQFVPDLVQLKWL